MQEEIWKDVRGFVGYYQVSNFGRVKSLTRYIPINRFDDKIYYRRIEKRVLKECTNNGYPAVNLMRTDERGNKFRLMGKYIHALVLEEFVGGRPKGMECGHYDGNRSNNRLDNIRYITVRENAVDDEIRLYNKPKMAKLTDSEIKMIRTKLCLGVSQKTIAKEFCITETYVFVIQKNMVRTNVKWPDIPKNFYDKIKSRIPGTKIYKSKLSLDDIKMIKYYLKHGKGVCELARTYKVDKGLISKIKNNKRYFAIK